jgi:tetratricopeptide (TPR) repeat protein
MFNLTLTARRILLNGGFAIIASLVFTTSLGAQPQDAAERQRALDLYESQNMVAALPLLEKVAAANPNDMPVISRLGFVLYATSVTEKDSSARQRMRERARQILLRARALGDTSNLTNIVLEALASPDSSQVPFSDIQAAEVAIREGEQAFVRGDMDKAIVAYKRALAADPHLYDAALYVGDAEFKKAMNSTDAPYRNDHLDASGVWFAKAIAIDPNRETAYRYWGDALDAQGKTNEARDKFVDAIVAEPYGQRAYVGLTQWGQRHKIALGHPKIEVPTNVSSTKPGEISIAIDPQTLKGSDDGSTAWMIYGITRASWMSKKDGSLSDNFRRRYPTETAYRHSLAEEFEALRMVAESVQAQVKEKKVTKLTISLDNLMRLHNGGLLEPFVLFARPDQSIARDYGTYRAANREKLRRYWLDVAILQ